MARLIDADALRARMYHEAFETDTDMQKWDSGCWIRYKLFENCIDDAPTLSPDDVRGGGCAYCKEDRDGYTMPLEKNAHAWVQYPNKLVIQFGKEIRKCEIKYCPMCGARMKGAEDGTTDNS